MNEYGKGKSEKERMLTEMQDKLKSEREQERLKRQVHTIEYLVEEAKKLGIEDNMFLLGGFVYEIRDPDHTRVREDIDFVIQGKEAADVLFQHLSSDSNFSEQIKPDLDDVSRRDFRPAEGSDMEYLDIRWVNRVEREGIVVWEYELPEEFRNELGGSLAIPESAFSEDEMTIGSVSAKFVLPEYSFLAKGDSSLDKDRFDKLVLAKKLDKEKLLQISADAEKAEIVLNVPEKVVNEFKQKQTQKAEQARIKDLEEKLSAQ